MNDPNGLVYDDGTWHLFFQHNPYGTRWGNMSWGHATSTDLVHWEEQPLAIPQTFDANGVGDRGHLLGLGRGRRDQQHRLRHGREPADGRDLHERLHAGAPDPRRPQAQSLAYSLDHGQTWTKYEGNPVYDRGSSNFRDPKVFRYTTPRRASRTGSWPPSRPCSTRWCSPAATT